MKYKPTLPHVFLALGLLVLGIAFTRSGSSSGNGAPAYGNAYENGAGGYGYSGFGGGYPSQGAYGGGYSEALYGGDFYGNSNLGTAVSSSGGSGYIALGGGDFVSW